VWLARAEGAAGWEKQIALKTILPHLAQQEGFLERFKDEARIATTLTHGNIVPVFEFGHDQDTYFLAMEYVDGWDLRTLLRRIRTQGHQLPEDLALYIGAEVCRGLDYAHQRCDADGHLSPIIHRDVSPSNILVSKDGDVRLVDFGIASARDRLVTTLTGELRGKIAYMSPEQATGKPLDPRSDLFSLGIVLYEALAGTRPFGGDTDMEVLQRVQNSDYLPLKEHRPDLSEQTYQLIDTALQLKPEDRFADASAMQMQMLDILYHKTGPVSARQLAAFCQPYDRKTYDSGIRPGQSFDDLLQEQLLALHATPTPSNGNHTTPPIALRDHTRTMNSTPTSGVTSPQDSTPPPLAAAQALDIASATPAYIEDPSFRRYRRRRRTLIGAIIVVLLLLAVASVLAFRLGARSGTTAPVIRVYTEPRGALVYFNGVSYGRSTLVARPAPGEWLIRTELDGYESQERAVLFEGDKDLDVRFELPALPPDDQDASSAADANDEDGTARQGAQDVDKELAEDTAADISSAEAQGDAAELTDEDGASRTKDENASNASPTYVRLGVRGLPRGATLWVNGTRQSDASSVRLPLGQRARIEAVAPGHARKSVDWTPQSSRDTLRISLDALPTGTVTVRFIGDVLIGEVLVDGTSYGVNSDAPRTRVELPVGTHEVMVRNKALDLTYRQRVDIKENQNSTLTVDWSDDSRAP